MEAPYRVGKVGGRQGSPFEIHSRMARFWKEIGGQRGRVKVWGGKGKEVAKAVDKPEIEVKAEGTQEKEAEQQS
jgi:hypothetical protein